MNFFFDFTQVIGAIGTKRQIQLVQVHTLSQAFKLIPDDRNPTSSVPETQQQRDGTKFFNFKLQICIFRVEGMERNIP